MNGKFYGVGIGPGDEKLLTIKAIETMEMCDIIVVPKSGAKENIAVKITKNYIKNKEVLEVNMPMIRDKAQLELQHNEGAQTLAKLLDQGKSIAFLTLGDPTIYSSLMYIHKRLTNLGYDTTLIPGITSFCASACALGTSLCENKDLLHIIPASYEDLDYALTLKGNKVLMKSGKSLGDVKQKIIDKNVQMVECATMDNEKIYRSAAEIDENASYFSIIIVKD